MEGILPPLAFFLTAQNTAKHVNFQLFRVRVLINNLLKLQVVRIIGRAQILSFFESYAIKN